MLTWTSQKPTQPGWYWWRDIDDFTQIIYVDHAHKLYRVQVSTGRALDITEGKWAGPLEPPGEGT